jgi:hypothetical protein
MTTTLAAVVTAACAPSTGRLPGLRARAQGLLRRWATLPAVQALEASARSELGLDGFVLKHPLHEPRHELYFDALLCIDALVQVLRELEAQAASGNVSSVRQYLDEAERYKNLPSDLVSPGHDFLRKHFLMTPSRSNNCTRRPKRLKSVYRPLPHSYRPRTRAFSYDFRRSNRTVCRTALRRVPPLLHYHTTPAHQQRPAQ